MRFSDGPSGPDQIEVDGKIVTEKTFWEIYHRFNTLSHKEQQKLIVKE
jgi:hypothetical protein